MDTATVRPSPGAPATPSSLSAESATREAPRTHMPREPRTVRPRRRRPTATSAFGVGRREAHDASDFYARFTPPEVSDDETVVDCPVKDQLFHGDAREMADVPANSIALVVTSPPYFAGKAYEQDLGVGEIPG